MPPKKKLVRPRLQTPEQLQRREQGTFSRRIRTVFTNAGFTYLKTSNIHRDFGAKRGELDQVFVYDNVILVCEDTLLKSPKDHLKNKKLLFDEARKNKEDLVNWLLETFPVEFEAYEKYDFSRYHVFFLYFSKTDLTLDSADKILFEGITVVRPATLGYFQKITQNIKKSSRTEIFRYLGLNSSDLGAADSGGQIKQIKTSIIYPNDNTGFQNGVRVVSFMMSAEMLLRNSYVLRKDNWQETIELYQRLIEKDRIQKIRKYLATTQSTFINNIIVGLPSNIDFRDQSGTVVDLSQVSDFGGHTMHIPDEMNSICVIDGQHRIFAHYEGTDVHEDKISRLRKKFHLLVTGLIYPDDMPDLERRKFESELFLDINSNSRPAPPDVLLFIETLKDPFSDLGVARQVLQEMNTLAPFVDAFQFSLMDDGKIKIASIIKFALRYLVDIVDDPEKPSLFSSWSSPENRERLLQDREEKKDRQQLQNYVHYCATTIAMYFSAVKATHRSEWDQPGSKIKSVVSINGFIHALRRSLESQEVQSFDKYQAMMKKLNVDFGQSKFPYASSQYRQFSGEILRDAHEIVESSHDVKVNHAP